MIFSFVRKKLGSNGLRMMRYFGTPYGCQLENHLIVNYIWSLKRTRNAYHLHIRKNKRMLDRIKRNNLLNSCINGNGNIFDEIRRQRKCKQTFAASIDGCTENIPSYLASNYSNIYNCVDDKCNLSIMEERPNTQNLYGT